MALEIKPGSGWWYARWMRDGRRHFAKLDVRIEGARPAKLSKNGDEDFEASRKKAQEAFDAMVAKWNEQRRPEDLVQEIHRVKFGHRIGTIPLPQIFDAWLQIPRKRRPKEPYVKWAKRTFKRLLEFIRAEFPRVKEMAAVDKKVAEAFMRHEEKRKVSPKTYNAELILLRGAFEHLREDAGMLANPFGKIVSKDRETIHRKPFTPEELEAILGAAEHDPLTRPLVVVGACTAMRRGDACLLKWEAVDLKNRYIRVKTSKTGETVEIPMFPLLYDELKMQRKAKSGYVFPELARVYSRNPDGINVRLRKVFKQAGFMDDAELKALKEENPGVEIVHRGEVHVDRKVGLRSLNVRGFHSFRVTWITMALAAGVPMELVRRVTGHKAAEVVVKNYFKPGREDFRKTILAAMPALLVGPRTGKTIDVPAKDVRECQDSPGPSEALGAALKALKGVTGKANQERVSRAVELIENAKSWCEGRVLREPEAAQA